MKRKVILSKLLFAIIILVVTSCSNTRIISSWSIGNPPANAMKKVLVAAVMPDREARDQIEQAMVAALNRDGISASTSVSVFGPSGFDRMPENDVIDRLRGSEFTSVIIVSVVNKETSMQYIPGTFYMMPSPHMGFSRFYRRYWFAYDRMYTPGRFETTTNWVLQADIFTINDDQLIYSAQTRSYDPNNARSLADGFTRAIIAELRTKGIIPQN